MRPRATVPEIEAALAKQITQAHEIRGNVVNVTWDWGTYQLHFDDGRFVQFEVDESDDDMKRVYISRSSPTVYKLPE